MVAYVAYVAFVFSSGIWQLPYAPLYFQGNKDVIRLRCLSYSQFSVWWSWWRATSVDVPALYACWCLCNKSPFRNNYPMFLPWFSVHVRLICLNDLETVLDFLAWRWLLWIVISSRWGKIIIRGPEISIFSWWFIRVDFGNWFTN